MMFVKFSVLFLQIITISSLHICKDCMKYTDCKAVHDRIHETAHLLTELICGKEFDEGKTIPKICCSQFSSFSFTEKPFFDSESVNNKEHLLPEKCGSILDDYRSGSRNAKLYEFPWMVLISSNTSSGRQFSCGGTIINSKYVLTAAHCVVNKEILGVRIGEFDISQDDDCEYEHGLPSICENHIQEMRVEKVISHREFMAKPYRNDIALLRVDGEIDFSYPNVEPICLPITPEVRNKILEYEIATVTGWGETPTGMMASKLKKVKIPVISNSVCHAYFKLMNSDWSMKNQICGGERGKDSCRGDSGGPLMVEYTIGALNRYVQYGIVSHGSRNCGSGIPGFYTDVTKYVDWMLDNMVD